MREKVDILISDALIVTMNSERRIIDHGYIAVRDGRIIDVGVGDGTSKYTGEETINGRGRVVTPGLMCAHTHFYGLLLTGSPWFSKIEPPTDFQQNLQRIWWALDVELTYEDAYASALIGSILFAKSGVTNFFDNISSPNAIDGVLDYIEKGVNEVGIRGIVSFEATQRRSLEEGVRGLRENERFIVKNNRDPGRLVKGAIYLHASFTVTDELFKLAHETAGKYGALIAIHTAEGLVDVYHNIERYGLRPVERMKKLGFLGSNVHLVHAVNITEDELHIIKETGVHVAHNPLSNMLNAVGVARVPEMLRLGVNVGIGNDGYVFDQFENMRATYLIHKLWNRDPRVLTPLQVFEMSTVNVARMFHVEGELGSIEVGKKADLVVLRPEAPSTPVNSQTVMGHIVNSFSSRDVDTVIVDGRIIVRNRKLTRVDEEKAVEYVHRVVERLWDRLMEKGRYQLDYLCPR
ncbi:amidohydrolase family protein [Desulfurococcus mucosus]|uniref:Amidohydrolase n=1 Tax=Desulfurococcus mucosus (strain ATCC 35584 / DSM 2162 / JCM 9187 / O7/1) TaxID=765177 RepID=E8R742_DESM0|nr:amidohydrolase [Desulfurococcus mucosus DSM 2162]